VQQTELQLQQQLQQRLKQKQQQLLPGIPRIGGAGGSGTGEANGISGARATTATLLNLSGKLRRLPTAAERAVYAAAQAASKGEQTNGNDSKSSSTSTIVSNAMQPQALLRESIRRAENRLRAARSGRWPDDEIEPRISTPQKCDFAGTARTASRATGTSNSNEKARSQALGQTSETSPNLAALAQEHLAKAYQDVDTSNLQPAQGGATQAYDPVQQTNPIKFKPPLSFRSCFQQSSTGSCKEISGTLASTADGSDSIPVTLDPCLVRCALTDQALSLSIDKQSPALSSTLQLSATATGLPSSPRRSALVPIPPPPPGSNATMLTGSKRLARQLRADPTMRLSALLEQVVERTTQLEALLYMRYLDLDAAGSTTDAGSRYQSTDSDAGSHHDPHRDDDRFSLTGTMRSPRLSSSSGAFVHRPPLGSTTTARGRGQVLRMVTVSNLSNSHHGGQDVTSMLGGNSSAYGAHAYNAHATNTLSLLKTQPGFFQYQAQQAVAANTGVHASSEAVETFKETQTLPRKGERGPVHGERGLDMMGSLTHGSAWGAYSRRSGTPRFGVARKKAENTHVLEAKLAAARADFVLTHHQLQTRLEEALTITEKARLISGLGASASQASSSATALLQSGLVSGRGRSPSLESASADIAALRSKKQPQRLAVLAARLENYRTFEALLRDVSEERNASMLLGSTVASESSSAVSNPGASAPGVSGSNSSSGTGASAGDQRLGAQKDDPLKKSTGVTSTSSLAGSNAVAYGYAGQPCVFLLEVIAAVVDEAVIPVRGTAALVLALKHAENMCHAALAIAAASAAGRLTPNWLLGKSETPPSNENTRQTLELAAQELLRPSVSVFLVPSLSAAVSRENRKNVLKHPLRHVLGDSVAVKELLKKLRALWGIPDGDYQRVLAEFGMLEEEDQKQTSSSDQSIKQANDNSSIQDIVASSSALAAGYYAYGANPEVLPDLLAQNFVSEIAHEPSASVTELGFGVTIQKVVTPSTTLANEIKEKASGLDQGHDMYMPASADSLAAALAAKTPRSSGIPQAKHGGSRAHGRR